jgi:uncharacterized protein (DUF305 family)
MNKNMRNEEAIMFGKKSLSVLLLSAGIGTGFLFSIKDLNAVPTKPQPMPPGGCMGQFGGGNHHQMMMSMQVQSEFNFLAKMIPHHQEAIATATILYNGTNRAEMKKFAQDIIRVQSAEIEQMQTWLKEWYPGQSTKVEYTPMMRDLTKLKGNDLDRAFLEDMRMHHMGAIMMSNQLLNHGLGKHNEVKTLATNISTSQRQEIVQMQAWLRDWYGLNTGMGCGGMGGMGGMMNPRK